MEVALKGLVITWALVALLVSGCDRHPEQVAVSELTESDAVSELTESDVVAKVNGEELTWGAMRKWLGYEQKYNLAAKAGTDQDGSENPEKSFLIERVQTLLPEMCNTLLFEQQVKRAGVVLSEAEVKRAEADYLESVTLLKGMETVSNLNAAATALGVDVDYLRNAILTEARRRAYLATKDPLIVSVPPEELARRQARVRELNAITAVSNAAQRAVCNQILAEIEAGLDFEQAGEKYGEVTRHQAKKWTHCTYENLINRSFDKNLELAKWAFSAPVGSVAGPFEMKDGFSIVKILGREEGALTLTMASRRLAQVDLARITIKAFMPIPVNTDAALEQKIKDLHMRRTFERELDLLQQSMEISYPNGTNFWNRLPKGWDATASEPQK